jgi:hypothetical protein
VTATARNLAIGVGLVAATALVLLAMGRVPICECGYVRLWVNQATGPENSQQIADWYTLSHVIHGFLFYGATWLLLRRWPASARLIVALVVECGWEIVENSPLIIERYRATTISLDYYGDSVLNSVCDVLAMVAGFALASRLPTRAVVILALAMELLAGIVIRDNLTLNVLMLVWPVGWVLRWQAGG